MIYHTTLEEFSQQHSGMSEEEFLERYTHPFLVVNLEGGVPMLYGRLACATTAIDEDEDGKPKTQTGSEPLDARNRIIVAPVIKSGRNKFGHMITVGRTNQNDIILPAKSVSKFHAYFQTNQDSGEFMVTDANSRFGTVVQGGELEGGITRTLENGSTLVFGMVARSTFLMPSYFFGYMHLNLKILRKWQTEGSGGY
jgi:hypothetical protein